MWWPLSARLAIALLRNGCRVAAICPPGHPLRFVTGVEKTFLYRGPRSIQSLQSAIASVQPDLIVPCDDGVVWQLHTIHAQAESLRPLIERSLGSSQAFPTISNRGSFLRAAAESGIRVPDTRIASSLNDIQAFWSDAPVVLKLDGTWGGSGVAIVHSIAEAQAVYQKLSRPISTSVAWKRWLINRDPIALWYWRRKELPCITIQEFIPGRPANTMLACWQGEVLAAVTVEVITAQGATGAATVVRLIRNEEIKEAARILARKFNLSGFHGLDFVLSDETGAAYLIELNPRCTQLGHLQIPGQGSLAAMIASRLRQVEIPVPPLEECIQGDTVAFFPQAFNWNPKSPYLHQGYHDVPWEEPALVRQLLRKDWPERQWLSKLYHHYRPLRQHKEVKF
jgi:predicted ATP-grasp superfamily ATP-dependent carboligase